MSHATESLEHAEHAGHGAHAGGPGKLIGLSMALLGVLLAFCAAQVGTHRTDLTKTMVEQTQVSAETQANHVKYRLVMLELEKHRAAMTPAGVAAPEVTPEAAAKAERALDRLLHLLVTYDEWMHASDAWVATFDPVIVAHAEAAEGFEHAQLAAEIGIVIASIALLLGSRKVWAASLVIGAVSIALVGKTFARSHEEIEHGEHAIEAARDHYEDTRKVFDSHADDGQTLDKLDPGGAKRAAMKAAAEHEHGASIDGAGKPGPAHGEK